MNQKLLATKPFINAIPTSEGWVHPKTKQLLVKIENLKWRLENEKEEIVKNEPSKNKAKMGAELSSNEPGLE